MNNNNPDQHNLSKTDSENMRNEQKGLKALGTDAEAAGPAGKTLNGHLHQKKYRRLWLGVLATFTIVSLASLLYTGCGPQPKTDEHRVNDQKITPVGAKEQPTLPKLDDDLKKRLNTSDTTELKRKLLAFLTRPSKLGYDLPDNPEKPDDDWGDPYKIYLDFLFPENDPSLKEVKQGIVETEVQVIVLSKIFFEKLEQRKIKSIHSDIRDTICNFDKMANTPISNEVENGEYSETERINKIEQNKTDFLNSLAFRYFFEKIRRKNSEWQADDWKNEKARIATALTKTKDLLEKAKVNEDLNGFVKRHERYIKKLETQQEIIKRSDDFYPECSKRSGINTFP